MVARYGKLDNRGRNGGSNFKKWTFEKCFGWEFFEGRSVPSEIGVCIYKFSQTSVTFQLQFEIWKLQVSYASYLI